MTVAKRLDALLLDLRRRHVADSEPILARARRALLDVWHDLPLAQQTALQRATPILASRRLQADTHVLTARALVAKRFADRDGVLTPDGLHVRSVGLEADSGAARRRYSRRESEPDTAPQTAVDVLDEVLAQPSEAKEAT